MYDLIKQLGENAQGMETGPQILAGLGVTLFAMAIVFSVLIILMFVIKGLKLIGDEKKTKPAEIQVAAPVENDSPATTPQVDDSEVIAAIMAAIGSMSSGEGSRIVIKNIVKKQDNWGHSGLLEQINNRL